MSTLDGADGSSPFHLAKPEVTAFTAEARAIRLGVRTPCRCFGGASTRPPSRLDLARNGLLLAVAVGGAVASGSAGGAGVRPAPAVLAAVAGAVAAVLVVHLDDLAGLVRPGPAPVPAGLVWRCATYSAHSTRSPRGGSVAAQSRRRQSRDSCGSRPAHR